MFDSLINYMDKFGPEILVIQFGFLVILSTLFMWLWFANRRKYHNLKHAIPANVVKSYLDSIIQNSTALKSSLFRGGGLDVTGAAGSVPSVMPLSNLIGGDSLAVSGAPSTALLEELNQKKAQIAALEAQLSAAQNSLREVESRLGPTKEKLAQAEARIKELEALLAQSKASGGGGDAILQSELANITKERDEIKDKLKEFEIISDDLANLKRLQQENEQLKRSLGAQGGAPAAAPAAVTPDVSDVLASESKAFGNSENQVIEDFLNAAEISTTEDTSEADMMAAMNGGGEEEAAATPDAEKAPKSDKTPEDLLSEFEKMLG